MKIFILIFLVLAAFASASSNSTANNEPEVNSATKSPYCLCPSGYSTRCSQVMLSERSLETAFNIFCGCPGECPCAERYNCERPKQTSGDE